ncbi:MAG: hypothetical protein ACKKMO_02315 [Candidatus Nealsonbacteria bacterium]
MSSEKIFKIAIVWRDNDKRDIAGNCPGCEKVFLIPDSGENINRYKCVCGAETIIAFGTGEEQVGRIFEKL